MKEISYPDFYDFQGIEQLRSEGEKDTILLTTFMHSGFGDLYHAISIAKFIKAKFPGYKIHLIVDESDTAYGEFVKKILKRNFTEDETSLFTGRDKDFVKGYIESHEKLKTTLETNVAVHLDISCPMGLSSLKPFMPFVHSIVIREYGIGSGFGGKFFENANLAVGRDEEKKAYGMKVKDNDFDFDTRVNMLYDLKQDQYHFKESLLGTENPKQEDCAQYLATHHFMPAYLQNNIDVTLFIATHILKHYDEDTQKLTKPCDFYVPARWTNEQSIRDVLEKLGFAKEKILFVGQDNWEDSLSDQSQCQIRIITNKIEDDQEYENMFYIDNSGAGGSGDNSFEYVFSSMSLPFIMKKDAFIEPMNAFVKTESDNSNLIEYFKRLWSSSHLHYDCDGLSVNVISEKIISRAKELSNLQRDPKVQESWELIRKKILTDFNFFDILPDIINTGLFITQEYDRLMKGQKSNPSLDEFRKRLIEKKAIQDLIKNGILSEEQANSLSVFGLYVLFNNDLYKELTSKGLSIDDLYLVDDFILYEIFRVNSSLDQPIDRIRELANIVKSEKVSLKCIKQIYYLDQFSYIDNVELLLNLKDLDHKLSSDEEDRLVELFKEKDFRSFWLNKEVAWLLFDRSIDVNAILLLTEDKKYIGQSLVYEVKKHIDLDKDGLKTKITELQEKLQEKDLGYYQSNISHLEKVIADIDQRINKSDPISWLDIMCHINRILQFSSVDKDLIPDGFVEPYITLLGKDMAIENEESPTLRR